MSGLNLVCFLLIGLSTVSQVQRLHGTSWRCFSGGSQSIVAGSGAGLREPQFWQTHEHFSPLGENSQGANVLLLHGSDVAAHAEALCLRFSRGCT